MSCLNAFLLSFNLLIALLFWRKKKNENEGKTNLFVLI